MLTRESNLNVRYLGGRRKSALLAGLTVLGLILTACGSSKSGGGSSSSTSTGTQASAGTSAGGPGSGSTINIGVLGAFSGALAQSGTPVRDGVMAWVQTVNAAGGINGHPVKAFVEDDKANPAASTQALRTLVEQDHVVALVGVNAQGTEQTWASYLQARNLPVVGGVQGTAIWNTNPLYFGVSADEYIKEQSFLLGSKAAGKTKVFAMYCGEIADCATESNKVKDQTSKIGVQWVGSASVSASSANFSAVCLQAKSGGATAVAVLLPAATFGRIADACHQQGFDPLYATSFGSLSPSVVKLPYMNGSYTNVALAPADLPATADYAAAMKKYYPDVDLATAQGQAGWAGGILFQTALKNIAATSTVTSADVIDGLNSIKNNDLGGLVAQPLTFEKGKPHPAINCIFTAHIKDENLVGDKQPLCAVGS